LADLDRLRAEASRATLDVGIQAVNAFLMVQERRRTEALVSEQIAFARDVVSAANARYASGTAPQSDVLRAEVEVARLEALARALVSEVRGAEAMLNTSLALDADGPVPPFVSLAFAQPPPSWTLIKAALTSRPELAAGRAEIVRAEAEVLVMRDMFRPMALIQTGPSGWWTGDHPIERRFNGCHAERQRHRIRDCVRPVAENIRPFLSSSRRPTHPWGRAGPGDREAHRRVASRKHRSGVSTRGR
jgi:hypothetical protein